MEMIEKLKNFVELCIRNLVENQNSVDISEALTTKSIVINVKVDKKDLGRVIGKKGRTIEAIKLLTIAIKNTHYMDSRQVSLELLEDESFIQRTREVK